MTEGSMKSLHLLWQCLHETHTDVGIMPQCFLANRILINSCWLLWYGEPSGSTVDTKWFVGRDTCLADIFCSYLRTSIMYRLSSYRIGYFPHVPILFWENFMLFLSYFITVRDFWCISCKILISYYSANPVDYLFIFHHTACCWMLARRKPMILMTTDHVFSDRKSWLVTNSQLPTNFSNFINLLLFI